jgi:Uma2 family endonuclease
MSTTTTLITADEYSRMHFDVPTELVRGEIVFPYGEDGMTRPGHGHGGVCVAIGSMVRQWARTASAGRCSTNDAWISTTRNPDSVRGADVSYFRMERLPDGKLPGAPTDIVPDLCVEVLSPSNRPREIRDQADEYLAAGIEEVWIADPRKRTVEILRRNEPVRTLGGHEELTSLVLLGFKVRVSEFFEDV